MGQEMGAFITVIKYSFQVFFEEEHLQLYFVLLIKLVLCDHLALNCLDRKHYIVYLFITHSQCCYDKASWFCPYNSLNFLT